jgi:nicotinate-nucleotide adenylyltransferase
LRPALTIGLLGGSFNPAHGGHRHISLEVMRRLKLDAIWWLVSPQNPLKAKAGMAPLAARLASARAVARHPRIDVSTKEVALGTVRTFDTLRALKRRFPRARFVWIMGADNLAQFHRWAEWRAIARAVPIVVVGRPGYSSKSQLAPAMGWLRRWRRHSPARWRDWTLPAILFVNAMPDPRSATAIRNQSPGWVQARPANRTIPS